MKPIRMFAATGMLGYGYAEESIETALSMDLDLIAPTRARWIRDPIT